LPQVSDINEGGKMNLLGNLDRSAIPFDQPIIMGASTLDGRVVVWLSQSGPALLHVHVNPMQLVMPPFTQIEPAIGMALYSTRAVLHGRGGDVWEMVKENFL
jgi:pyruvate dehydrogenase (quinone)